MKNNANIFPYSNLKVLNLTERKWKVLVVFFLLFFTGKSNRDKNLKIYFKAYKLEEIGKQRLCNFLRRHVDLDIFNMGRRIYSNSTTAAVLLSTFRICHPALLHEDLFFQ